MTDGVLYTISIWVLPLVIAITFHEAAHGFVAWRLGDPTAYRRGRVTFNPLKHIDLFGTIVLPTLLFLARSPFLFGYAKPVPVNFAALRRPRRDMVWVALAGPGINLVLAVVFAAGLHIAVLLPPVAGEWLASNLINGLILNIFLAVFNMIPIPPLDGGRVAVGLLPRALALPLARLERWGFLIIIGAIFLGPYIGNAVGLNVDIFAWVVGPPVRFLLNAIGTLVGVS
ncbi:MAG: site-2 protease family protein [Alphaproteobacteria bacterium]|nr:site-2 protease family protein [Alphaproteobacteria bacterium]